MKYSRFELLTLSVGAVAIVGTLMLSLGGAPVPQEIAAQVLLLGVLVAAVHWGRRGGFIGALAAVLLYVVLRIPTIAAEGMSSDVLAMLLVRVVTYGIVGIVGGELCSRIKYVFAGLEDRTRIDELTRLYNGRMIGRLVSGQVAQHERYSVPMSVIVVSLSPALTSELRPSRQRAVLRGAAALIRNDVRLVDEVGRLDDGRFVLLLPQTPKRGGEIAAERIRKSVCDYFGARDGSVAARVIGLPEDLDQMKTFQAELPDAEGSTEPPAPPQERRSA